MKDGTFEEKLDAILECLYVAYIKSIETENSSVAFIWNLDILKHLTSQFTANNITFESFMERLIRDNNVWTIPENGGKKYKITPQGIDLITSGDSYIKRAEREKEKRDLEMLLLKNQIKTNDNVKTTNKRMVTILWGTVAVAVINLIPASVSVIHDFNKDYSEDTVKRMQQKIEQVTTKNQEQSLEIKSLNARLDSCKKN